MSLGWTDQNALRGVAYLAAAGVCVWCARSGAPRRDDRSVWPAFWWISAILLAGGAIGRWSDGGALLGDALRGNAVGRGWYDGRRPLQVSVVAAILVAWLVTIVVAMIRVPERRRRYRLIIAVQASLVAFTAVRLVSLHHIDAVLHRRDIAGARVGTLLEYALVALVAVVSIWTARFRPQAPVDPDTRAAVVR